MYDCSDVDYARGLNGQLWNKTLQDMAGKAMYLPRHNFGSPTLHGLIEFQKYENWIRCMSVPRAAYLFCDLGYKWDTFNIQRGHKNYLLQTTFPALAIKPEFLSEWPQNIWCSFTGGPPGHRQLVQSSLLNLIVDRIYNHILCYGVEVTDAKIIAALNYAVPLCLEAPCGA